MRLLEVARGLSSAFQNVRSAADKSSMKVSFSNSSRVVCLGFVGLGFEDDGRSEGEYLPPAFFIIIAKALLAGFGVDDFGLSSFEDVDEGLVEGAGELSEWQL
jgi:hypothetical protein